MLVDGSECSSQSFMLLMPILRLHLTWHIEPAPNTTTTTLMHHPVTCYVSGCCHAPHPQAHPLHQSSKGPALLTISPLSEETKRESLSAMWDTVPQLNSVDWKRAASCWRCESTTNDANGGHGLCWLFRSVIPRSQKSNHCYRTIMACCLLIVE